MRRRLPLLLAVTALSVMTVYGQKPVTLEGTAGLAFPTGNFGDANTGMALGVRGGYGLSSALDATGVIKYNRYASDTEIVDVTLSTLNLMVGGRYKIPSETSLGIEAGSEIGFARVAIDINNPGVILTGVDGFDKAAGPQIRIEGDSEFKLAWSLLGAVTYNIVANTVLFLQPSFNMIFADETAHHLDVSVGARFQVGGE